LKRLSLIVGYPTGHLSPESLFNIRQVLSQILYLLLRLFNNICYVFFLLDDVDKKTVRTSLLSKKLFGARADE
jgi:hypothetical protein